ncbi:toxin [Streptomyces sp. NPDC060188]|uniref:toxin n=1 Tax=Streptomyces sp. NPDC060188 TaxID=3347068 RepID=UPI0036597D9A
MRKFADALIDPIRVKLPADPEDVFGALVASVNQWRGRPVLVHRAPFPPHTATGLWLERDAYDDVIIEERAIGWHQIVILAHEVWHMKQGDAAPPQRPGIGDKGQPAAARTDFVLAAEQEADQFGMLVGRRLRALLEATENSVLGAGPEGSDDLAGRIGAALNYRGTRR